ncbi:hypothetical protein N0V93_004501 [Gnomoniopsis smithogilvyi]|uniref:Pisatin demethylase n=1 Tax=Gnomoniopsis smithogilvyi TaxID=1191159 RepID=A0A9W9CVW7_9PEZI|nr:hypothetical protein N0V93_004501 [Gnomoniopsis smithogilvyi]
MSPAPAPPSDAAAMSLHSLRALAIEKVQNFSGAYILIALAAYVVYCLLNTLTTWYRLRKFPGPPLASLSSFWLARTALTGRAPFIHAELLQKHAHPFIRIAPDILITDDPTVHRHMNGAQAGYVKAPWYSSLRTDAFTHSMFSSRDVTYHDDVKARVSPGYTGRDVPGMEAEIDEGIAKLKDLIRREYVSAPGRTKKVDFSNVPTFFALDSLSKMAFGEAFGYLAANSDIGGWIKSQHKTMKMMVLAADVEWLGKILFSDFVLGIIGPKKTDKNAIGKMMAMAHEVVTERTGPKAEPIQDMLGSFISRGLSPKQCEVEILLQIAAGADTTASVIRFVLILVSSTPHVYRRLQQEIDDGIAAGTISNPVTAAEGKALPYLQAVIFETIRFHPPAFGLLPKVVPPKGDVLAGHFVPGGTKIAFNSWMGMRRTDVFGADVDVFRPERWTEASPEDLRKMQRVVDQIFGWGRYRCAGRIIALLELNKIFVELFREFDFQLLNPGKPWSEELFNTFVVNDMWMRVSTRQF